MGGVNAARVILPVLAVEGGELKPRGVYGSAWLARSGLIVTCRHCLPSELPKGQFLAAARKHQSGVYEIRPLTQIGHDSRGYDLATASVEFDAEDQAWPLYPGNCEWGMSIWSWGYPLSLKEEKPDGNTALRIYPRFLRGYVTRRFLGDPPTFPQVELDMQCPPGLSGAPIVYEGTDKVLGLVFAHNNTEIGGHPVYHYGYAFDRELLDGLAGPATNGLPLGKVLA